MIICPSCAAQTPAGGRFCVECGTPLAAACPGCGAQVQSGQKFCAECGTPLGTAAAPRPTPRPTVATPSPAPIPLVPPLSAAPVAERRLVSILFADLVGFTPFAAERDAEDVRAMLTRYFELASDVITRYGGVVEKFIGDAVMAVWGAPTAREDDAELAVRAALELVDTVRTLGPTIQARAGVLTGEAAVTIGAVNQGMVAGDIVNTAARLQSVAQPGTVLTGESTMRASSSAIAFEPAGAQALKGKESPVPAFRALRVVAEVGGKNRAHGLEAPFVGRDDEMRQLKDLFHGSARDRRVRLVSVIGPAGIGKSRLAWEFLKYIDGVVDTVWWHQGRSPAYGSGMAFWALGEMIRGRCGLRESDDEATTRAQVAATVAEHVPDPEERRWIEPALLALLGVGGRGAASDQLFAAWRTFFERLAQTAPVILLFEDLHWADAGTIDFIDHLLDWTRDLPITIITLARPELLDRRSDWGAGKRHFTNLFLEPLHEPAMRELLAGLVPGLPERAVRAIVARADGMPLYAVETVRSLLADGQLQERDGRYEPVGDLSDLAVPDTLTALIASRLDALDPVDRALLQDAAVLGQSFAPTSLSAVSGTAAVELEPRLRGLVRREILSLQADSRSPERGQYSFVQALIREVAYNQLAKRDRKAKHLAAARWFESVGSDELAGALARHYLAAWQHSAEGPEADALAGQARLALTAAAERSIKLHAHEQAIELLREAAEVATDPVERSDLLSQAAASAGVIARYAEVERLSTQARDLAIAADDGPAEARALRWLVPALLNQLRRPETVALVRETYARTRHLLPHPDVLRVQRMVATYLRADGDLAGWRDLLEETLVAAERIGDRAIVLECLNTKGVGLCDLGRTIEGLALLDAVVRLAPAAGLEQLAVDAQANAVAYSIDIDPRAALEGARALIEVGRRTSNRGLVALNIQNGAEVAIRTGDWAWADAEIGLLLLDDLDPSDRLTALESRTNLAALRGEDTSALMAESRALAGDTKDGREALDDRLATIAWVEGRYGEAADRWRGYAARSPLNAVPALTKAARMALWSRDVVSARGDLAALDATGQHGAAVDAHRAAIVGGIAALDGDVVEARRRFRDALEGWEELRLPWEVALVALDMVLLLGPDEPEAAAAGRRGLEILTKLGAQPFAEMTDEALAAAGAPRSAGPAGSAGAVGDASAARVTGSASA